MKTNESPELTTFRSRALLVFIFLQVLSFFAGSSEELRPIFVASQLGSFGILIHLYLRDELSKYEIILVAVLFRLLYVFWLPGLSDDAFRYIWDGMLSQDGINPFSLPPNSSELAELQRSPVYDALNSKRYFAVYPPLSQYLFYLASQFTSTDALTSWIGPYAVIKIVRSAAEMGAMLIIVNLLRPKLALLYALNPLILVECAGQAHAEASMVLGLAMMIYGVKRDRSVLATLGLVIACWTKLYPLLFLPILLRKIGYRYVLLFLPLSVVIVYRFISPDTFTNVSESVDLYVRSFEFNAGIYYGLKKIVNWWTGVEGWGPTIGPILRTLFYSGALIVLVQNYRRKIGFVASAVWIASLYLMTATTVHPWYFISLFVLIPFLRPIRWEWFFLAAITTGTYLRYTESIYWPFVIIGWIGWASIWLLRDHRSSKEVLVDV